MTSSPLPPPGLTPTRRAIQTSRRVLQIFHVAPLLLIASAGCVARSSPLVPTREVVVAPQLLAAYELLGRNDSNADWAERTVGAWATAPRGGVARIIVSELPIGIQAEYDHVETIKVSTRLLEQPAEIIAGFIAHEIRHADGRRHDCADNSRDTANHQGAWYVQIKVLESYGRGDAAAVIRQNKFCEI
jgi:hypothetical protein